MNFEDLTPEQQAKAKGCKTPEELLELAKAEGYELSDDELEDVAGGKLHWYGEECIGDCAIVAY
jgi:hypothetical protein